MVWADESIKSKSELLVLLAIADHCNDQGLCWPSIETLAKKSRISQRQTQRLLENLFSRGKLTLDYNAGPKGTNVYGLDVGGCHGVTPDKSVPVMSPEVRGDTGVPVMSPEPSGTVNGYHQEPSSYVPPPKQPKKKFTKPTVEEAKTYGTEIELPEPESESFWNYYESNGWKVGRNPMVSWHHAMANWKKNWRQRSEPFQAKPRYTGPNL